MRKSIRAGRWLLAAFALLAWNALGIATAQAQSRSGNPQLDALLNTGVLFPSGQLRKLRPPSMPDGLNAAQQTQVIQSVLACSSKRRRSATSNSWSTI